MGAGGPTPKAGPAAPGVAGAYRRRYVEIDDCLIQNPAYSLARTRRGPGESQGLFWSLLIPVLPRGVLVDAAEEQLPAVKGQVLAPRLRVEGDDPPHRVHPQLPEGMRRRFLRRHLTTALPTGPAAVPKSPPAGCPAMTPQSLHPHSRRRCTASPASGCGRPPPALRPHPRPAPRR